MVTQYQLLFQWTFFIGSICLLLSSVLLYFVCPHYNEGIFGAAALVGIGGTTITVSAYAMISDLIGSHEVSFIKIYNSHVCNSILRDTDY